MEETRTRKSGTDKFRIWIYVHEWIGAFLCVCTCVCVYSHVLKGAGDHQSAFPRFADCSGDKRNLNLTETHSGINWDHVSVSRASWKHKGGSENLVVGGSVKESVPQDVTAELSIQRREEFCQVKCLYRENEA